MKATWKLSDGSEITAEIANGTNMMQAAVDNNVPGVVGECGGCLSCATCHVYVDANWIAQSGSVDDFEDAMLDVAEAERTDASRLSCQIEASDALDGIVLLVPQP
ncbi:ferredoxin, 2Fe-2S [Shimia gijangensis]|uniref:Ferredoxin, 2Fe-2S n=1 Tax=Shimia gijangensis TaxID=1470563 RepID=A0A1M6CHS4_9RHOB|nr:2Fe-2S iron-sulfur cluster-binding protein [Shimia gijangensis]SHI60421.1 ferredoxin, 2Fe-2S [Shimia gijangensis]